MRGLRVCASITTVDILDMDTSFVYKIRVEGHLADRWSTWFDGLAVQPEPNGETRLTGRLSDQAALYGVLAKIHNLNLVLVSVVRLPRV
jgi:hypothetical protein